MVEESSVVVHMHVHGEKSVQVNGLVGSRVESFNKSFSESPLISVRM